MGIVTKLLADEVNTNKKFREQLVWFVKKNMKNGEYKEQETSAPEMNFKISELYEITLQNIRIPFPFFRNSLIFVAVRLYLKPYTNFVYMYIPQAYTNGDPSIGKSVHSMVVQPSSIGHRVTMSPTSVAQKKQCGR